MGVVWGAHLVAPQPVAGVHDERFPTVVVLPDVQAALGALVFYLWGGGKRGVGRGKRRGRKERERGGKREKKTTGTGGGGEKRGEGGKRGGKRRGRGEKGQE